MQYMGWVHVECGYIGGQGDQFGLAQTVMQKPVWSETFDAPGVTANAAVHGGQKDGEPVFRVSCAGTSIFFAIGPNPDPTNGPRTFLRHSRTIEMFGEQGDKFAWTFAYKVPA